MSRRLPARTLAALALVTVLGLGACGLPQDRDPQNISLSADEKALLSEPSTTSSNAPARTRPEVLYFVEVGGQEGEDKLVPVTVQVRETSAADLPRAIVEQLKSTPAERRDDVRSFIPEGTQIESVRVEDGVATVNFANLGTSIELRGQRLATAQIVFTLTQLPNVERVRFETRGQAANAPIGNNESSGPGEAISRGDYPDLLASLSDSETPTTEPPAPETPATETTAGG
jgi:hypothetical protein